MYDKHKYISIAIFLIVTIGGVSLNIKSQALASNVLTVIAIVLGFYISAISTLYGKPYIKKMGKEQDDIIKNKTKLGVLTSYFKTSINLSLATMIASLTGLLSCENLPAALYQSVDRIVTPLILALLCVSLYLTQLLIKQFINILINDSKMDNDRTQL